MDATLKGEMKGRNAVASGSAGQRDGYRGSLQDIRGFGEESEGVSIVEISLAIVSHLTE